MSKMKVGGRWQIDADGGRMQQQWNPRMRFLDVNGLGEKEIRMFGKNGSQKEISDYRHVWPRRVCSNKK